MAASEGAQELQDLVQFLRSPRADIRKAAVGMVQGLAATADGAQQLRTASDELLPALLWLMNDESHVSKAALTSLVNLSQDAGTAAKLLGIKCIEKAVDYIKDGNAASPELLTMLLTNVTTTEAGSCSLLQIGRGDLEGFHMGILLGRFLEPVDGPQDPYAYVAHIMTNVTRIQKGRDIVLEPGRGFLQALVSQIQSPSAIRRQGCSAAFRNLCFGAQEQEDTGEHDAALEPILSSRETLVAVTKPLNGESSPAADDDLVREALAEAVLILASSEKGRKALWTINTPELLRKGYEAEENSTVCQSMERTAELFISGAADPEIVEEEEAAEQPGDDAHKQEASGHAAGAA